MNVRGAVKSILDRDVSISKSTDVGIVKVHCIAKRIQEIVILLVK